MEIIEYNPTEWPSRETYDKYVANITKIDELSHKNKRVGTWKSCDVSPDKCISASKVSKKVGKKLKLSIKITELADFNTAKYDDEYKKIYLARHPRARWFNFRRNPDGSHKREET